MFKAAASGEKKSHRLRSLHWRIPWLNQTFWFIHRASYRHSTFYFSQCSFPQKNVLLISHFLRFCLPRHCSIAPQPLEMIITFCVFGVYFLLSYSHSHFRCTNPSRGKKRRRRKVRRIGKRRRSDTPSTNHTEFIWFWSRLRHVNGKRVVRFVILPKDDDGDDDDCEKKENIFLCTHFTSQIACSVYEMFVCMIRFVIKKRERILIVDYILSAELLLCPPSIFNLYLNVSLILLSKNFFEFFSQYFVNFGI